MYVSKLQGYARPAEKVKKDLSTELNRPKLCLPQALVYVLVWKQGAKKNEDLKDISSERIVHPSF